MYAHCLDFREDNFAIPDILSQARVDIAHERLQFGHFVARFPGRGLRVFKIPSDGTFRVTHLSCNIDNVSSNNNGLTSSGSKSSEFEFSRLLIKNHYLLEEICLTFNNV